MQGALAYLWLMTDRVRPSSYKLVTVSRGGNQKDSSSEFCVIFTF